MQGSRALPGGQDGGVLRCEISLWEWLAKRSPVWLSYPHVLVTVAETIASVLYRRAYLSVLEPTSPNTFAGTCSRLPGRTRTIFLTHGKSSVEGVCDGCALGVAGLHDWTIQGVHSCMTRLNLLRLNTMPAMPADVLEDVRELQGKSNRELRSLGRLATPHAAAQGEAGFHRVSWDEAFQSLAEHFQNTPPQRSAFFVTAKG